jgi:hypothetical protein
MTDKTLREAAVMALEALHATLSHFGLQRLGNSTLADSTVRCEGHAAAQALSAALASSPEQAEPVADRAAWFAVAMNAAASLEDAANCLRDQDAKASALGAAKHVRAKCNAMWFATQPAAPVGQQRPGAARRAELESTEEGRKLLSDAREEVRSAWGATAPTAPAPATDAGEYEAFKAWGERRPYLANETAWQAWQARAAVAPPPPAAQPVALSDEQIAAMFNTGGQVGSLLRRIVRGVEAHHGIPRPDGEAGPQASGGEAA